MYVLFQLKNTGKLFFFSENTAFVLLCYSEKRQKNGISTRSFSEVHLTLKSYCFSAFLPEVWHSVAHHDLICDIRILGKKWKIRTSRGKNGEDFQYQSANPQTGTCSAGSDILRLLRCRCRKILCRILPAPHPYWMA